MTTSSKTKNPLKDYFLKNKGKRVHKWMHYLDIYNRHFSAFKDKKVTILEFGVEHGGSLQMWKHYFGKKARIIGVDIDPRCKDAAEKQIEIFIGDQGDKGFLRKLIKKIGPIDIAIDDGGHFMEQQITTFEAVFSTVKNGGIYLTEDLHTSYWGSYNGGYKKPGTFIEYAKDKIDDIHGWYSLNEAEFKVNNLTRSIKGIHFYDSIVVFEKAKIEPPHHEAKGSPALDKNPTDSKPFTSSAKNLSMKSLLICLNPNITPDQLKLQINNTLKYFRPEDILVVANFPFTSRGIKTILTDKNNQIEIILDLLQQDIIKGNELWWYHDSDIFQTRKVNSSEIVLIDVNVGFVFSQGHSQFRNLFFKSGSLKFFEWIINRAHRLRSNPETAFKSLADENYRGFNSMYKKLVPFKNFN